MFKPKLYMCISVFLLSGLMADEANIQWDYSKDRGPKYGGELDKNFAKCQVGKMQTPIDIIDTQTQKTQYNLAFAYARNTKNLINNGHSIQVNIDGTDSTLTFNGSLYQLVQFHFHTPSENRIDGIAYPLEVHLVHKNADGKLLVVSVLFEEGTDNAALEEIIKSAPHAVDKSMEFRAFDISTLLPKNTSYYEFIGSLTTPPCTENVQWVVMKNPLMLSQKQLESLQNILHHNAREVQPLNERVIKSADQ